VATNIKKGKTVCSKIRDVINVVDHVYRKDAVRKILALPVSRADERAATNYLVAVTQVKDIRMETKKEVKGAVCTLQERRGSKLQKK
jgi:hypothetical protein